MITVFIGTYNRLGTLQRTIDSYDRLVTPHELVIVDNGTDNEEAVSLLDSLKDRVKAVYRYPASRDMNTLANHFVAAIEEERPRLDKNGWVAVSEADVSFEDTDPGCLEVYTYLARKLGRAVGPHLRVDSGIPWGYPMRSRVLACESRLLYKNSMEWIDKMPFSFWQIDTTFHLFPVEKPFNRLFMNPARVGPPYDAMHLDWYLDIFHPTRESEIYIQRGSGIGSWGKSWIADFWIRFQEDLEGAVGHLLTAPRLQYNDLDSNSFIISWCYQYGIGVEQDRDMSQKHLLEAIPYLHESYWPHKEDWLAMIYENDFTSLGWE